MKDKEINIVVKILQNFEAEMENNGSKSKILIIGGSGYMGSYMVKASLKLGHPTYVFTRPNSSKIDLIHHFQSMGATIVKGKLEEHGKLVAVMKEVEVVISALAYPQVLDQFTSWRPSRFVPSDFGVEEDRVSVLPPFEAFLEKKRKIRRAIEEAKIPYTYVSANCFGAYFINYLLHPSDPNAGEITVYGSGEAKFVMNYEEDIGLYTIKVAIDPRACNRTVIYRPSTNILTQLELISKWEMKTGKNFKKIHVSEEEVVALSENSTFLFKHTDLCKAGFSLNLPRKILDHMLHASSPVFLLHQWNGGRSSEDREIKIVVKILQKFEAEMENNGSKSKILIIGGSGYIGSYMVKASLKLGHPTYVFTRPNSSKNDLILHFQSMGATIVKGKLEEHEKLVAVMKEVEVVISTLAYPQVLDQFNVLEAIKVAGNIKRFLPSDFGVEEDRISVLPPFEAFLEKKRKIRRAIEEAKIPYTYVSANCFGAYFINYLLHPSDPNTGEVTVYGSGEAKFVMNYEEDIGLYTIKVATDPRACNRTVIYRPSTNILTQLELISKWEMKTGKNFKKIHVSEEEFVAQSEKLPEPDNIPAAILHSVFIKGVTTGFDLEVDDIEASDLYPDMKFTTVDELLDVFVHDPPKPASAAFE